MANEKNTIIVDTFERGAEEAYLTKEIDPADTIHLSWLRTHVRWCALNGRDMTITHKDASA